jgi:hypothetical protein
LPPFPGGEDRGSLAPGSARPGAASLAGSVNRRSKNHDRQDRFLVTDSPCGTPEKGNAATRPGDGESKQIGAQELCATIQKVNVKLHLNQQQIFRPRTQRMLS